MYLFFLLWVGIYIWVCVTVCVRASEIHDLSGRWGHMGIKGVGEVLILLPILLLCVGVKKVTG